MPLEPKKPTAKKSSADVEKTLDQAQIEAWSKVCEAIKRLPRERQKRVLKAAEILYGLEDD